MIRIKFWLYSRCPKCTVNSGVFGKVGLEHHQTSTPQPRQPTNCLGVTVGAGILHKLFVAFNFVFSSSDQKSKLSSHTGHFHSTMVSAMSLTTPRLRRSILFLEGSLSFFGSLN